MDVNIINVVNYKAHLNTNRANKWNLKERLYHYRLNPKIHRHRHPRVNPELDTHKKFYTLNSNGFLYIIPNFEHGFMFIYSGEATWKKYIGCYSSSGSTFSHVTLKLYVHICCFFLEFVYVD